MPNAQNTAIAESSRTLPRLDSHCMPNALSTENTIAESMGLTPRNTPMPIPPNEACVMPPLMNVRRRVTMYVPTSPHTMLASAAPMSAFLKKPYSRMSIVYKHYHFVLQFVGKGYAAQRETAPPCLHLVLSHGVQHVAELLHFLLVVAV